MNESQREDISSSRRLSSNATSFPWFLPFGRTISDPAPPSSRNAAISRSSVGLKPMESNDTSQNETISLLKANLNVLRTQRPDVISYFLPAYFLPAITIISQPNYFFVYTRRCRATAQPLAPTPLPCMVQVDCLSQV